MFYSSLPHAGSANRSSDVNFRFFGTFFPKDPEDDELWLIIKDQNTTAPLPLWFAESLCCGSQQATRGSKAVASGSMSVVGAKGGLSDQDLQTEPPTSRRRTRRTQQ